MEDVRQKIEELLAQHAGQFRELHSTSEVDRLELKEAVVRVYDEDQHLIAALNLLLTAGQRVVMVPAGAGKCLLLASPQLFGERGP